MYRKYQTKIHSKVLEQVCFCGLQSIHFIVYSIRSENWHIRMASVKSMAANFTAFDLPVYQKLISQHILDVHNMPVKYFENGSFVLSISGNAFHSIALDESHEMLMNKHVKQAIVRHQRMTSIISLVHSIQS